MKKLLSIAFLFCGINSFAQIYVPQVPTTYGSNNNRVKAILAQHIPEKSDTTTNTTDTTAQIFLLKSDSSVWAYYKQRGFFKIGSNSGGSGSDSGLIAVGGYIDTITFPAHPGIPGIIVPLSIGDSVKHKFVDTGSSMRNGFVLSYDSTLKKWKLVANGSGGGSQTLDQTLTFGNTSSQSGTFGAVYAQGSGTIRSALLFDTHGGALELTNSINHAVDLFASYVDSSYNIEYPIHQAFNSKHFLPLTVNGVSADSTGNITITVSGFVPVARTITINGSTQDLSSNRTYNVGTLVAGDTVSLSNRVNLKVNIADTSSMLSPYLRKTDTSTLSNRINLKVNISDTSSMLSHYINSVGYGLTKSGQIVSGDTTKLIPYTDTLKLNGMATQTYVNNHVPSTLSFTAPLANTSGVVSIKVASSTDSGYVSNIAQTFSGDKTLSGITSINNLTTYVTPQFYGAAGDNSTNDIVACQSCINSGKPCVFISLYKIVGTLTVPNGSEIYGFNDSITGLHTGSNSPALRVIGSNIIISNFLIRGDSTGGSTSLQSGISVDSVGGSVKYNININGMRFHGLNRGYYGYRNGANGGGIRLSNSFFDSCSIGMFTDSLSEYNHATNLRFSGNSVAFKNSGGNNSMSASVFDNNTVGVWIAGGGTNDGHSIMSGCTINASITYCVYATNVLASDGYTFDGCVMMGTPAAPINISSSSLIKFIGCDFRTQSSITAASSTVEFNSCKFITTPTISRTSGSIIFWGNNWVAGLPATTTGSMTDFSFNSALAATVTNISTTANTVIDAFVAQSTLPATSGNQTYGGFYHSIGQGWKTTATAASQAVDWRWGTVPVQGATNPLGLLNFDVSIGGGAFTNVLALASQSNNATNDVMLLTANTIADQKTAFKITGTMPTTPSGFTKAADLQITGAGSASQVTAAFNVDYLAGYTGSSRTIAGRFTNSNVGTGATPFSSTANMGLFTSPAGTTTGTNIGILNNPAAGNINYGVFNNVTSAKNSAKNIGIGSFALNTGSSPIEVGGFFGLMNTEPTYESAAGIFDNGSETVPILLARANGTKVFTVGSTGILTSNKMLAATGTPTVVMHQTDSTLSQMTIATLATTLPATGNLIYAHTIFTPTTGQTISLIDNQYNIVNPAGALLALTVNLPSSPINNDVVYIKYTQNITTVTYANGTVVDGITAPTAGGLTVLTYDSGNTSWY